jgi:hypothetical protein
MITTGKYLHVDISVFYGPFNSFSNSGTFQGGVCGQATLNRYSTHGATNRALGSFSPNSQKRTAFDDKAALAKECSECWRKFGVGNTWRAASICPAPVGDKAMLRFPMKQPKQVG